MIAKKLSKAELEQIDRCVLAAIEGSFFEGGLFHTLTGLDEDEALEIYMSRQMDQSEQWGLLVNNALLNLVGYPHRKPDELYARTLLERNEIRTLLVRFREMTGRTRAQDYFEGME